MYTKSNFGNDLKKQLECGLGIIELSNWAHQIYLNKCTEFESGVSEIVFQIIAMQEGEEFEYSIEELKELAQKLQEM